MRVALIVPPFIPVPPKGYGGTELFAAHLAEGLVKLGIDVVVYTNGESTVAAEKRWLYPRGAWPIDGEIHDSLMDVNHGAWAVEDAAESCDIIHLSNAPSLVHSRFVSKPFVYTIHHPHEKSLTQFYSYYPQVNYVSISNFQRSQESLPNVRTIHHGIDPTAYRVGTGKREYLTFLGRIAPVKGTHLAIAVAKKTGIPLKIAGEVQPLFREYYEREVKPHVDGRFIEYIGEAGLEEKNELLSRSLALLFPIQWNEPFGLVMVEAMACGAPVLALPGGSVPEIVKDGVSGWVCPSVDEMAQRAETLEQFDRKQVRAYVETSFALEKMVAKYAELYRELAAEPAEFEAVDTAQQRAIA